MQELLWAPGSVVGEELRCKIRLFVQIKQLQERWKERSQAAEALDSGRSSSCEMRLAVPWHWCPRGERWWVAGPSSCAVLVFSPLC